MLPPRVDMVDIVEKEKFGVFKRRHRDDRVRRYRPNRSPASPAESSGS